MKSFLASKMPYILSLGPFILMLFFSGCMPHGKQAPPVHFYRLFYDAPKPAGIKTAAVIRIKPVKVMAPYDSKKIVYLHENGLEQGFYRYHRWAAFPNDMIFNLISRDIRRSGISASVITNTSALLPTHILEIVVNRFYEKDGKTSWKAIVSLTARLIKEDSDGQARLLFEKTYSSARTLEHKNPKGLARALSLALSDISGRMIHDIGFEIKS